MGLFADVAAQGCAHSAEDRCGARRSYCGNGVKDGENLSPESCAKSEVVTISSPVIMQGVRWCLGQAPCAYQDSGASQDMGSSPDPS